MSILSKKSRGLSNLWAIIIIAILIALIIILIIAAGAIIGALTSDVGKDKAMITGGSTGGMCDQSLTSKLAEVQMGSGTARVSQFGLHDANTPSYCNDPGNNSYAWSNSRPTGCDVNNSADYFAAVCTPAPAANCGSTDSWWANRALIITNPKTGKQVTVTIIDKGPHPDTGRQLDLSYAAIHTLGVSTDDTVNVCIAGSGGTGSLTGKGCGNVPSLKQYDPAWASVSYDCSDGSTIKSSGCGITSAAMILQFYGKSVDPPTMAQLAISHGDRACGSGTAYSFFPYIAAKYGLKDENSISWDRAMTLLKQGKPIIVSGAGPKPFSTGGHFIVLTCYNSDGTISVNDPGHANASYPEALIKQYEHFATAIYQQ